MRLIVKDLSKEFDQKSVLNGINYTFEEGKIYALLGRNGAGKTTFFNCLSQEIDKNTGEVLIEEDGAERTLDASEIGYVVSTPTVPEFLTGREFLKFFLEIQGRECSDEIIEEQFEKLRIDKRDIDILMRDYSHGMKNKMQMIVNMIYNPPIIFLDEPLTSFDVVVAEEMKDLLREYKKGHILILSTHILDIALDLCDEIVILNQGYLQHIPNTNDEEMKAEIIKSLKEEAYE